VKKSRAELPEGFRKVEKYLMAVPRLIGRGGEEIARWICNADFEKSESARLLFPLPSGEGQGEGCGREHLFL
jgi:hypothetical protein